MRATSSINHISALEGNLSARRIRDALGISRERMARVLDISTRTVERWEERAELPANRAGRQHLAELQHIVDLGLVVYGPEGFHKFLTLPMPIFGGRTPLQILEQGDLDRVYAALAADYEGQGF